MLSTSLLSRSLAQTSPFELAQDQTNRLVNAIQPAPHVRFRGPHGLKRKHADSNDDMAIAHSAGVNAAVVDKFEGR